MTYATAIAGTVLCAVLGTPVTIAAQSAAPNAKALPAWDAFKKVADAVKDYTETVSTHETRGTKTEDRVYHFSYASPQLARSTIVSGPGAGGEAVWHGGDHIKGHQGGFLRFVKLELSITDPRATDIRGKTIDAAFFPAMIASFEGNGKLSEEPGQPEGGVPTDDVILIPSDPSKVRGLTKDVFVLSRATHLPVEHRGYEGTQLVEDEHFTDQKINPDLPPSTFEL